MLLIYSPEITPRLQYALKLIFKSCVHAEYELTDDAAKFNQYTGPKLTYGKQALGNEPFIWANGLLADRVIIDKQPERGPDYHGLATIYHTDNTTAIVPFDVLAASFYIVTRYEEYELGERDQHGRYIPTNSINYKYGFLNKPIVNIWAVNLAKHIQAIYPEFNYTLPTFQYLSTIDVDNAWAFAHKGWIRAIGGVLNDLLEFKFKQLGTRLKSWGHDANDPYNTYHIIEGLQERYKHKMLWFFLIGDYGFNDKNPNWENHHFQALVKRIAKKYPIGVHPSYASFRHLEKIHEERERLEFIDGGAIDKARCHFLRMKFPETYRALKYCEIRHDYTMIHSPLPGFRAGICTMHKWYDIPREEETGLTIHPSTVMEGTLRDYMKLSPTEGLQVIEQLMNEVKAVGGTFISIWHNDSFSQENKEWIEVYEGMLKLVN